MFQFPFLFQNQTQLQPFIEKMKNNELSLENILEEKDIIQDLEINSNSEFLQMISFENIRRLIDYATKFPISDEHKLGYSYPFCSTKILCSNNNSIIDRIMNEIYYEDDSDDEEDQKEDKNEKIKINGKEDSSPNNENINKSNEENKKPKLIKEIII